MTRRQEFDADDPALELSLNTTAAPREAAPPVRSTKLPPIQHLVHRSPAGTRWVPALGRVGVGQVHRRGTGPILHSRLSFPGAGTGTGSTVSHNKSKSEAPDAAADESDVRCGWNAMNIML